MKKFFFEHPFMKIVSLLTATLLWLVVQGERRTVLTVDVPIQVKHLSDKHVITTELEPAINLRLVGPKTRLSRLERTAFAPYPLDMSKAVVGPNSFWLHETDFRVPRGVSVTRIIPQVIRVTVEPAEEKLVRIEPRFANDPDEGFEVAKYKVYPSFTKKRGSRKDLASTSYIYTEPISLAGRHEDFSGEYALAMDPTRGLSEEKRVKVKVWIGEKQISKLFRDVPIRVVGFKSAVKVDPRTVSIRARGMAGDVLALGEEHLHVEIDADHYKLTKVKGRTITVKPRLPKRSGLELSVVPDTLRLTLLTEKE